MKSSRAALFSFITSCLLVAGSAQAASFTWNGATSSFSTGSNWLGGSAPVPATSNDFLFTGTTTSLTADVTGATYTTSALTFAANAAAYTINPFNGQTTSRFSLTNGATITQLSSADQTINATLLTPTSGLVTITGNGSGGLAINSLRYSAGASIVVNRSATFNVFESTGWTNTTMRFTGSNNSVITFAGANTGSLANLVLNSDSNSGGNPATSSTLTLQTSNASGFTSSAAVLANDVTFGGSNAITFTGRFAMIGNAAKVVTFNNTGTTTFSGTAQFGAAAGTASRTVSLNANTGATAVYSGLVTGDASSGVTSVTKTGAGTVIFSGSGNYNGTTTVSAGTLLINGNYSAATGAVQVGGTATLGGSGSMGGAITLANGSFLAPGSESGAIGTLAGTSLTWNSGAVFQFTLGAAGVSIGAPGVSDFLSLSGSLVQGIDGVYEFDFLNSGEAGVYKLATAGGGFSTFDAGDFSALNLAGGRTGSFSIVGSDLFLTVVPEPGTWALLALAFGPVVWAMRRRRAA